MLMSITSSKEFYSLTCGASVGTTTVGAIWLAAGVGGLGDTLGLGVFPGATTMPGGAEEVTLPGSGGVFTLITGSFLPRRRLIMKKMIASRIKTPSILKISGKVLLEVTLSANS
jgi:hypothetical protein